MPGPKTLVAIMGLTLLIVSGCGAGKLVSKGDVSLMSGRPAEAVIFYQQALGRDAKLLKDPVFVANWNRARMLAAYDEGCRLGQDGRWDAAVDSFNQALQFNPAWDEAHQALDNASRQAAHQHYLTALAAADRGDLATASAEIQKALRFNSANSEAAAALNSLSAPGSGEPGRLFLEAQNLSARNDWGQAAERLRSALAQEPSHLPARAEMRRCNQTLAQAQQLRDTGRKLLNERRFDEAIATLEQGLRIWPSDSAAAALLGQATAQRAEADRLAQAAANQAAGFERQGFLGNALIWYLEANRQRPQQLYADRLRDLRAGLRERARLGVALAFRNNTAQGDDTFGALQSRVSQLLAAAKPGLIVLVPAAPPTAPAAIAAPTAPAAQPAQGGPAFTVNLDLNNLQIATTMIGNESRTHDYAIEQQTPNPNLPALQQQLAAAQAELVQLQIAANQLCPTCAGGGLVAARLPGRPDGDRHDGPPRPREGLVPCPACHGTGRISTVSPRRLQQKNEEVSALQQQLASEPPVVMQAVPARWVYGVQLFQKTGQMNLGLAMTSAAARATVFSEPVQARAEFKDNVVTNPNPPIGLPADDLDLPADKTVRSQLVESAAVAAANKIIDALVGAHLAEVNGYAAQLSKENKETEAIEVGVTGAIFLESFDPTGTVRTLEDLRQQMTTQPVAAAGRRE